MGVERAITRWYAHRQLIQGEVAVQQTRLIELQADTQNAAELAEAEQELAATQARLLNLGPCPQPMMG